MTFSRSNIRPRSPHNSCLLTIYTLREQYLTRVINGGNPEENDAEKPREQVRLIAHHSRLSFINLVFRNIVRLGWSAKDALHSAESTWKARTPDRSPRCEVCGYHGSTTLSNFRAHVRTHVSKHLVQTLCPTCSGTFSLKGTLTRHIMRHHPADRAGDIAGQNQNRTTLAHDLDGSAEDEYLRNGDSNAPMLENIFSGIQYDFAMYAEWPEIGVEDFYLAIGLVD